MDIIGFYINALGYSHLSSQNHVKIVAGILQRIMYIYLWYVMDMVEVAMFEVILVLKLQQMLLLKNSSFYKKNTEQLV